MRTDEPWWILPDIDVLQSAFDRREVAGSIVHRFQELVRSRRLLLLGWMRQQLLTRTQDERNRHILERGLSGFRDLQVLDRDHVDAARRAHRMREMGGPAAPYPLLMWSVAERLGAGIWSRDPTWHRYRAFDCPVVT